MTYTSGLVKADISGSTADNQPSGDATTLIANGADTWTVPAGKKWIVTTLWAYSTSASASRIRITGHGLTDVAIIQANVAYQLLNITGSPALLLTAGEILTIAVTSGTCGITYYEVDA